MFKKISLFKYFTRNLLFNYNFHYNFKFFNNKKIFYFLILKNLRTAQFINVFNFKYYYKTQKLIYFFKKQERRELIILKFLRFTPFLIFN